MKVSPAGSFKGIRTLATAALFLTASASALRAQEFLDRVDEVLTFTAFHDTVRARISGLLDLEGYYFQQPPPGLIEAGGETLFNPRLTMFLDVQIGPHVYAFIQSRADRGFDPADHTAEARLDEYAIRVTPWNDGRFNFQAGKFATVVGNWVERHLSWENPFVTAPLPYENPTGIYDREAPAVMTEFSEYAGAAGYDHSPVLWGPTYATGAAASGRLGQFEYAAEIKNASLSSRPETWDPDTGFQHPTFSGRLGARPNETWNFGVSASQGPYFRAEARQTLPARHDIDDYNEYVLGHDVRFAWHHLQLWAEFYAARFEVPRVGNADTFAYYIEAKYKFAAQWFGALRWNQQAFATVPNGEGGRADWGQDTWRTDVALGYRLTAHAQVKVQYSLQEQPSAPREFGHLVAAQLTLRF